MKSNFYLFFYLILGVSADQAAADQRLPNWEPFLFCFTLSRGPSV